MIIAVASGKGGTGKTGEYCGAEGIPVLMRIPHDRRIAEAILQCETLVEALPDYRHSLRELYEEIATQVAASDQVQ
jgi:MinD superfamily P-loop ATPase